jgi:hypothetical protein
MQRRNHIHTEEIKIVTEVDSGPARDAYEFLVTKSGRATRATCVWQGIEYFMTGVDAERELARVLVRDGAPDGPIVRGAMRGRTLHGLASRRRKVTSGWYNPLPNSPPDPLVMAVVAEQRALAATRKAARAEGAAESQG